MISFKIILWQNISKQQEVRENNKSICHIQMRHMA